MGLESKIWKYAKYLPLCSAIEYLRTDFFSETEQAVMKNKNVCQPLGKLFLHCLYGVIVASAIGIAITNSIYYHSLSHENNHNTQKTYIQTPLKK